VGEARGLTFSEAVESGGIDPGSVEKPFPGGEDTEAFRRRVSQAWRDLPEGRGVLVTHGGVIRVLMGWAESGRTQEDWSIDVSHGSRWILAGDPPSIVGRD